jgi:hypothetical protein
MSWMILLLVFGLTLGIFLAVMIGMAIGVILGRKRLTGSCGGLANRTGADGETNCSLCARGESSCPEVAKKSIKIL